MDLHARGVWSMNSGTLLVTGKWLLLCAYSNRLFIMSISKPWNSVIIQGKTRKKKKRKQRLRTVNFFLSNHKAPRKAAAARAFPSRFLEALRPMHTLWRALLWIAMLQFGNWKSNKPHFNPTWARRPFEIPFKDAPTSPLVVALP